MRKLSREEISKILRKHELWINCDDNGEKADFSLCDLSGACLSGSDLRWADLREADLSVADLSGADLHEANLSGANLDFACWPLWCGSLGVKADKRIMAQLAYHFCRVICDDPEVEKYQRMIAPLANQFHRVEECGKLPEGE